MDVKQYGVDYRPLESPKRAILYWDGKVYDVFVKRFMRGRVKIELPIDSPVSIRFGRRLLRPGACIYVSPSNVEIVSE